MGSPSAGTGRSRRFLRTIAEHRHVVSVGAARTLRGCRVSAPLQPNGGGGRRFGFPRSKTSRSALGAALSRGSFRVGRAVAASRERPAASPAAFAAGQAIGGWVGTRVETLRRSDDNRRKFLQRGDGYEPVWNLDVRPVAVRTAAPRHAIFERRIRRARPGALRRSRSPESATSEPP